MQRHFPLILASFLVTAALLPGRASAAPAEDTALRDAIVLRDAEFFELFFQQCDPPKLAGMLTSDLEFYHDRDGVVAMSAAPLVAGYAKSCEARKAPDAWRSRRALIATSVRVDPVPGYGAIEDGEHVFYERKGDGPEKLVGKARFTQLWKNDNGTWKLARVLSYAHEAVK